MINGQLIGILALLIGAFGLFCPIMLFFHLNGRLRDSQVWMNFGVLMIFVALISLVLVDFSIISDSLAHILAKIFLTLSFLLIAVSSRKMCNLIRNIPQSFLDKLNK
jgi:hypothetical protein